MQRPVEPFQRGWCEGEQTRITHSYYSVESEHASYLLHCVPSGALLRGPKRCPVLVPGSEYALTIAGDQAALWAAGATKAMKFDLVESRLKP